jgi:hypothetical protein
MCSGIGDVKNAMSGKRMSWLWKMMTLCAVTMAVACQKMVSANKNNAYHR